MEFHLLLLGAGLGKALLLTEVQSVCWHRHITHLERKKEQGRCSSWQMQIPSVLLYSTKKNPSNDELHNPKSQE